MSFEALKRDSDKRWLDLTTGSKPWIRVSSAMCCGTSLESDSIVSEIVNYSEKNKIPINIDHKKFSYVYDVLTRTAPITARPTATQFRRFILSFKNIAAIRVIRIVDS